MWSVIAVIGLEQYPLCYIQMYYWLFAEFWRHEYKWTCYEIWSYLWHNWRKDWESCDLWFWLLTVYIIQYSIQCIWQCVHKGRNSSWNVCSSFTDTYSKFYRLVNIECRILKFIDHYIVLQTPTHNNVFRVKHSAFPSAFYFSFTIDILIVNLDVIWLWWSSLEGMYLYKMWTTE